MHPLLVHCVLLGGTPNPKDSTTTLTKPTRANRIAISLWNVTYTLIWLKKNQQNGNWIVAFSILQSSCIQQSVILENTFHPHTYSLRFSLWPWLSQVEGSCGIFIAINLNISCIIYIWLILLISWRQFGFKHGVHNTVHTIWSIY